MACIASKSEDPRAAPDHVIPIDAAPLSSARVNGVKVLALRLEAADDPSAPDRSSGVDGVDGDEDGERGVDGEVPKEILMYAGAHYSSWQASIRRAQMEINWLLDADTLQVARVLVAGTNTPRVAAVPFSVSVKVAAPSLAILLHHDGCDSDPDAALLDCRMDGVSGSLLRSSHSTWEFAVAGLAICTATGSGAGGRMRTMLAQRSEGGAPSGDRGPFLRASLSVEDGSKIPTARLRVQAMDV